MVATVAGKLATKDYCSQIVEDFHILAIPLCLDCIMQDYILPFKVVQSSSKQHICSIIAVIITVIEGDIQVIAITIINRVESIQHSEEAIKIVKEAARIIKVAARIIKVAAGTTKEVVRTVVVVIRRLQEGFEDTKGKKLEQ